MFNPFKKKNEESNSWKDKAKNRRKEVEQLKKRVKELEKSRNTWKSKANKLRKKNIEIDDLLKKNF